MKTNFKRLRDDLRGLFDSERTTPKPLLFLIFLLPVGTMLKDLHEPGANAVASSAMYLAGGIVAWALLRGAEPEPHPAKAPDATTIHRVLTEGTTVVAALVRKLGGSVTLTNRDLGPAGVTTIHTTKHPDGTYQIEVKRHG